MSTAVETGTAIRPFQVEFQKEQIDELRRRIAATRWPSKELVTDRSQGVQLAATQALARYWLDEYDFGRIEARLNALPQFMTEIDGLDIHFIHVKLPARGRPAADHHPRLAGLRDRATRRHRPVDRSHRPRRPGRGRVRRRHPVAARLRLLRRAEGARLGPAHRVAQAWAELMSRLGYTRYVAQGGDVGAAVTHGMGALAPDGLIGIHTNLFYPALAGRCRRTPRREGRGSPARRVPGDGFGYFVEQANRPQTIGYALLDSPIALAAWLADHDTDAYYKIASAFVDDKPSGASPAITCSTTSPSTG